MSLHPPETIFIDMLGNGGRIRPSYTDLYNMVDLAGYKRCLLNEIEWKSDNIYVCSFKDGLADSAFSSAAAKNRNCKIVLWHLEWPEWKDGQLTWPEWAGEKYNVMWEFLWADEIWVSDLYVYELVKCFNPKRANKVRYVFLGGHPDFGNPNYESREKIWDAVHLMYLTGMRGEKFNTLVKYGISMAPNGWGEEREFSLLHSRWGLHLHQNPMPVIAPQRFMVFASYGLPIITDFCSNPEPYKVFPDALVNFDPRLTSVMNDDLRREATEHNYRLVTQEKTFRKCVDEAISSLLAGQWN